MELTFYGHGTDILWSIDFDKGTKTIQWENKSFQQMVLGKRSSPAKE
jgi:hypothetical protein